MAIATEVLGADLDRFTVFRQGYVVCEQDQSIFVTDQKRMSTAADTVTRMDAARMAHCPDLGR